MSSTPLGTAALNLLHASPDLVVNLVAPLLTAESRDTDMIAAVALAYARTQRSLEAKHWFNRLFQLLPEDVEVAVCLAESAIDSLDPAIAVTALERAFALDKAAETPAGRRARILAFKLEKQLNR